MDDLISRQSAIDILEERLQANGYSNVALVSELNRSIGYLMRLPSAERHGEWIQKSTGGESFYTCSRCGFIAWEHEDTNYCPHCGALMNEVT